MAEKELPSGGEESPPDRKELRQPGTESDLAAMLAPITVGVGMESDAGNLAKLPEQLHAASERLQESSEPLQAAKDLLQEHSEGSLSPQGVRETYRRGTDVLLANVPDPVESIMFTDEPNQTAILMQVKNLVRQAKWVGFYDVVDGKAQMHSWSGQVTNPSFAIASRSGVMSMCDAQSGMTWENTKVLHLMMPNLNKNIFAFPMKPVTDIGAGLRLIELLSEYSHILHHKNPPLIKDVPDNPDEQKLRKALGADGVLAAHFGTKYSATLLNEAGRCPNRHELIIFANNESRCAKFIADVTAKLGLPKPASLEEFAEFVPRLITSLAFQLSINNAGGGGEQALTDAFREDARTFYAQGQYARWESIAARALKILYPDKSASASKEKNPESVSAMTTVLPATADVVLVHATKFDPRQLAQNCLTTARIELAEWRKQPLLPASSFEAVYKKVGAAFEKTNSNAQRLLAATERLEEHAAKQPGAGATSMEIRSHLSAVIRALQETAFHPKTVHKMNRPEAQELFLASALVLQSVARHCYDIRNALYGLVRDLSEGNQHMRDHLYQLHTLIRDQRTETDVPQPHVRRGAWFHREALVARNALIPSIPDGQNDHAHLQQVGDYLRQSFVDSSVSVPSVDSIITKGVPLVGIHPIPESPESLFLRVHSPQGFEVGHTSAKGKAMSARDVLSITGRIALVERDGMTGDATYPSAPPSEGSLSLPGRSAIHQYAPHLYQTFVEHLDVACPALLARNNEILRGSLLIRNHDGLHLVFPRVEEQHVQAIVPMGHHDSSATKALLALHGPALSAANPDDWASVTLPTIEQLEEELLRGEDLPERFEGTQEESSTQTVGTALIPGEKTETARVHSPTKRLRIVRNQVLKNRKEANYWWDIGGNVTAEDEKKPNFAEVKEGHYVVINLADRQIVIRDAPESSYVLPGLRSKGEMLGHISPGWLRSQGKPLCFATPEQFADVVHQAINMPADAILTANHGSIDALIASHGNLIRDQIANLLVCINDLRQSREQPPFSPLGLTASQVHHWVYSGKANNIPLCGQTFLRHLAVQANVQDVDSYQAQKSVFEVVRDRLFAAAQENAKE